MRLSGYQNKLKSTKKAAVDFSDPLKSPLKLPDFGKNGGSKLIRIETPTHHYTKKILSTEKSPLRVYFWVQIAARGL